MGNHGYSLTRRSFLQAILAGAAGGVGVPSIERCLADSLPSSPRATIIPAQARTMFACNPSLEQVRRGDADAREYARGLEKCIPEAEQAIRQGIITGIRYNPDPEYLSARIAESYRKSGISPERMSQPDMRRLVALNAETLDSLEGDKAATILPSTIECIGNRVPPTVCLKSMIITSPFAVHDGDIRSIVIHEIEHAKDFFYGFTIGAKRFEYRTIKKQEYSLPFIEHIGELRALYKEIEISWKETIDQGSAIASPEYLSNVMGRYIEVKGWLDGNSSTPQERQTRDAQFSIFSGIHIQWTNQKPVLRIDMHGKTGTIAMEFNR